jgi:AhpD family alkylhydroperoxidase
MTENKQPRIKLAGDEAVRELEARGSADLRQFFELMRKGVEAIPGVPAEALYAAPTLQALAMRPGIFASWFEAEYHTLKRGEVPARLKELVALVVAKRNEEDVCSACAPYHAGAARFEGADAAEVEAATAYSERAGELSEALRATLDFGLKCAFAPKDITEAEMEGMRRLGYSDEALVEIAASALLAYSLSALGRIFDF